MKLGQYELVVRRLVPTYRVMTIKALAPLLDTTEPRAGKLLRDGAKKGDLKVAPLQAGQQKLYHPTNKKPGGSQAIPKHLGALSFCAFAPPRARRIPAGLRDHLGITADSFARHPLALANIRSDPWLFCIVTQISSNPQNVISRMHQIADALSSGHFASLAGDRRFALAIVLKNSDIRDDLRHALAKRPLPRGVAAYLHVACELDTLVESAANEGEGS